MEGYPSLVVHYWLQEEKVIIERTERNRTFMVGAPQRKMIIRGVVKMDIFNLFKPKKEEMNKLLTITRKL